MEFNLKRVAEYIRGAPTEELLDRVTVYREGMEPAALDLMEGELDRRGVTRAQIAEHDARHRASAIMLPDGTAMRCSFCDRPAVLRAWRWHRLRLRLPLFGSGRDASLGVGIPVFPWLFAFCEAHRPLRKGEAASAPPARGED